MYCYHFDTRVTFFRVNNILWWNFRILPTFLETECPQLGRSNLLPFNIECRFMRKLEKLRRLFLRGNIPKQLLMILNDVLLIFTLLPHIHSIGCCLYVFLNSVWQKNLEDICFASSITKNQYKSRVSSSFRFRLHKVVIAGLLLIKIYLFLSTSPVCLFIKNQRIDDRWDYKIILFWATLNYQQTIFEISAVR